MSDRLESQGNSATYVARLLLGCLCVAMVILMLCGITRSPLKGVLLGSAMSVSTFAAILLFAVRSLSVRQSARGTTAPNTVQTALEQENDESPRMQFRISTLLFLMLLLGIYMAAVRELAIAIDSYGPTRGQGAFAVFVMTLCCVVGMFLPWLYISEAMMRALAFAVHRPWGRRIARVFFRGP